MLDVTPFNNPVLDAVELIDLALSTYPGETVLACSFGGPTGMVALDTIVKRDAGVPVYYLDTDLLFPETYDLIERVKARYGVAPIAVRSPLSVLDQAARHGDALWARDPDTCCNIRKVEPHTEFLRGRKLWITGVRRDQSTARAQSPVAAWDERFGVIRLSPFLNWSEEQTWAYVREHDVPYNDLNDRGYPSVGCVPCTRAIAPGEDRRAGRWPGSTKTECGLQLQGLVTI
jgi:phosphoadenosine phosphosulfate reductase